MLAATTTTMKLTRFIHLFSNSLMDKKSKRDFGFFFVFCLFVDCSMFVHIKFMWLWAMIDENGKRIKRKHD